MAGVWSWHDPLVVRLVENLINTRMVQSTVDKIDPEIGKHQEDRELKPHVTLSVVLDVLVEFRVSADLQQETRCGEDGHHWDRSHGLRNFLPHLIFEEFGVLKSVFIENEYVRKRCEDEIYEEAENPAMRVELANYKIIMVVKEFKYHVTKNRDIICLSQSPRCHCER